MCESKDVITGTDAGSSIHKLSKIFAGYGNSYAVELKTVDMNFANDTVIEQELDIAAVVYVFSFTTPLQPEIDEMTYPLSGTISNKAV